MGYYDWNMIDYANQNNKQQSGGGFPWGQLLGAGLGTAGAYFGQGSGDVTSTFAAQMNPFTKKAAGSMLDIANVGKGLTIGGPQGAEANFYNTILPMLAAQQMGSNVANMGNLQNIIGQGPQSYLPQEVGFMQALRGQGPQAFYPGQQFDQANAALTNLMPAARQNLATQLQQQYGNLSGPTAYGQRADITQSAGGMLEAQLAGMQQQQANTQAQAMQQAQLTQPALMNMISGYQQNANQLAPQMAMQAMQGQQALGQQIPQFGNWMGMGTNTYLDRLRQAQNLYAPMMGLQGTQRTETTSKDGGDWWAPLLQGAAGSLLGGGGGGSGWGDIFGGLSSLGKTIGSWF